MPAPEVITEIEGKQLRFTDNNGRPSLYGISKDLASFETSFELLGREIKAKPLAAKRLADLTNDRELLEKFANNPAWFWEEWGYAQTGWMSTGLIDRREANVFFMKLEISSKDADFLRSQGYNIESNAQGRNILYRMGNIDTDTGGHFHGSIRSTGEWDFSSLYWRYGEGDLGMTFFDNIAYTRNYYEDITATAQGRAPRTFTGQDMLNEAFGPGNNGPVFKGARRWCQEVGSDTQYKQRMAGLLREHDGEPVSLAQRLTENDLARLEKEGVIRLRSTAQQPIAFNGLDHFPLETTDGRAVLRAEHTFTDRLGIERKGGAIPAFEALLKEITRNHGRHQWEEIKDYILHSPVGP
jgi:hypothetical protein